MTPEMTSAKRFRRGIVAAAIVIGVVAQAGNGMASAQSNCGALKEPARVRCEQEKRVEKECAGRTGDALAACRIAVLEQKRERQDCSRLPEGYARYKCEDENLRAEVEARCGSIPGAMSGDAYRQCYADVMAKAVAR